MSAEEAAAVLRQGAGTRYDSALVDVFIDSVASRSGRDAAPADAVIG
jgi:HD-GYP domain-containing protein (c-di-GMP phosphodiesterase class II)